MNGISIPALEQALLNIVPARRVAYRGAAVVRAGQGAIRRSNSAIWLDPGDDAALPSRVAGIESLYARLALPCRFRITPLSPPALEPLLIARGYGRVGESVVMAGPLDGLPLPDPTTQVADAPDEAWFEACEAAAGRDGPRMAEERDASSLLMVPAAWLSVREQDRIASVAFVGVDGAFAGLSSVATLPVWRGRGLARRACLAAFGWARAEGARLGWLSVEASNDPALSLYRRLGLREVYRYAYRERA